MFARAFQWYPYITDIYWKFTHQTPKFEDYDTTSDWKNRYFFCSVTQFLKTNNVMFNVENIPEIYNSCVRICKSSKTYVRVCYPLVFIESGLAEVN